jgi:hypothetical protein
VHSATPSEDFPLTFGAPGRGSGFRFFAYFLARHDGLDRRAPRLVSRGLPDGGRDIIFHATRLLPPCVWCCCYARCAAAHAHADIRAQSGAAPSGALSAARELLRNPPSSTASPGTMRQWREDIDRLLGMAHPGSVRSQPRSFRRQREASASVRSPSVKGARTDDLWAELNRRRACEDARISLERARERRQNFEGRNLDQDFTARGARIHAGVPLVGMGCAALADHLRAATWPPKFQPHLPKKYDGTSNPSEFLQVYVTAFTTASGNTTVMASYFHVALTSPRGRSTPRKSFVHD